jgi:hypothetical protein
MNGSELLAVCERSGSPASLAGPPSGRRACWDPRLDQIDQAARKAAFVVVVPRFASKLSFDRPRHLWLSQRWRRSISSILRERKKPARDFGKALRALNRTVAFDKILARKWQNLVKTT